MNVSGWPMFLYNLYLQCSDTQATPSLDVPEARVPSTGSPKSQALCIAICDYHSSGLLHPPPQPLHSLLANLSEQFIGARQSYP